MSSHGRTELPPSSLPHTPNKPPRPLVPLLEEQTRNKKEEEKKNEEDDMFYSHSLLSRKGPLGTIWIAAYCFKKLKRKQISATDVSSSVDKIIPEIQISHRVLAQLLLGIVKIFSRQVDYLYDECNEALSQIKKKIPCCRGTGRNKATIRKKDIRDNKEVTSAMDDAMEVMEHTAVQVIETMRASYHEAKITLPERFELDLLDLGVLDEGDTVSPHQHSMSKEELKDDGSSRPSFLNERFFDEVMGHSDYNFATFTPLAEVLPSGLMDIDLGRSEAYNTSTFVTMEKHQEVSCDIRESEHENLSGTLSVRLLLDEMPDNQIPLNIEHQVPAVSDQTQFINLQDGSTFQNEKVISISPKHNDASPSDRFDLKLNISGTPSPKLITPAIKERPRLSRKRKKKYDENIILSNEVMRQRIHDASDVVCKRRKAPHTVLDGWKSRSLSSLRQNLIEPLIPFSSPELQKLPQKKPPYYLSKICANHIDPSNVITESLHISPDTEIEKGGLMHKLDSTSLTTTICSDRPEDTCQIFNKEFSSPDASNFQFEIMDLCSHEDGIDVKGHKWSVRTRAAAQYLYNRFLELRERKHEETLSFSQILEGKTRPKCAIFFYETLNLKTRGCIDVRQDFPYGDIIISAASLLETFQ